MNRGFFLSLYLMKGLAIIWIYALVLTCAHPALSQDIKPDIVKLSASLQTGLTEITSMDTLITGAQVFHPQYKNFPGWSELGNMGLPALPNRYTGLGSTNTPSFLNSYLYYLEDPDKIHVYNTKTPFSRIHYNSGGTGDKNGQNLGFMYTRNFGREINMAGQFDFISSGGDYMNQASVESTIALSLAIEKSRYKHYISLERIQFKLQENGGVIDDNDVIGNDYSRLISVNLEKATSKTGIIRLRGWQYLDILAPQPADSTDSTSVVKNPGPMRPLLIHRYNFNSARRIYSDGQGANPFYSEIFIDSIATMDSLQHYSFVNDINARFHGLLPDSSNWMLEAGIHHELFHLYSYENSNWKQSLGIGGISELKWKNLNFQAKGIFNFAGYGAGDYQMTLKTGLVHSGISKGPVVKISSKSVSSDLFVNNFMSNHFQWTNDFSRQKEHGLGVSWILSNWKLALELNSYLISNWIYFDALAKPAQKESTAFLTSAGISKTFKAGPFRSKNSVFLNYTNADEIPLPSLVASTSTFMHHDIHFKKTHGLLQVEYGLDVRYTSAYKGYAYMPATGVFHLQNERVLGNYPFIDIFLIMQVKRTRFFVKWDHINSGFMGDNIFPVLHYPVKQRYLKFGFSWHFYD